MATQLACKYGHVHHGPSILLIKHLGYRFVLVFQKAMLDMFFTNIHMYIPEDQ